MAPGRVGAKPRMEPSTILTLARVRSFGMTDSNAYIKTHYFDLNRVRNHQVLTPGGVLTNRLRSATHFRSGYTSHVKPHSVSLTRVSFAVVSGTTKEMNRSLIIDLGIVD